MLLFDPETRRQHFPWLMIVLATTTVAAGWYAWASYGQPRWPSGGSLVGLTLGVAAGLLILFEFLIWPRRWKKVRAWRRIAFVPLGSARTWLRAHIWLGLLTVPLAWLHGGLDWGGTLSFWLMWVFLAVIASGIFGLTMQQVLPRILLHRVPEETIRSQIDQVVEHNAGLAEDLMLAVSGTPSADRVTTTEDLRPSAGAGTATSGAFVRHTPRNVARTGAAPPAGAARAGDIGGMGGAGIEAHRSVVVGAVRSPDMLNAALVRQLSPGKPLRNADGLQRAFEATIRPYLQQGSQSRSPLRYADSAASFFRELRRGADESALNVIEALEKWCEQRRQFDVQKRLHRWLHAWLVVHLPLSIALMLLLGVHIIVALKYW